MIGAFVVWNILDLEGKPTTNIRGQVMATGYHNFEYRLLIKLDSGELRTVSAADIRVVEEAEYVLFSCDKPDELGPIWGFIETLGLTEEAAGMTASGAAIWLLDKLFAELKELAGALDADQAQIELLTKERDEAIARAKAKGPKVPKPEEK